MVINRKDTVMRPEAISSECFFHQLAKCLWKPRDSVLHLQNIGVGPEFGPSSSKIPMIGINPVKIALIFEE